MKKHFRSIVAVILSALITITACAAVTVSAATTNKDAVSATTYYLWYGRSNQLNNWVNYVKMDSNNSATIDIADYGNYYFTITTSTTNSYSNIVTKDGTTDSVAPTITKNPTNIAINNFNQNMNYDNKSYSFIGFSRSSDSISSVKITLTSTSPEYAVTISNGEEATTAAPTTTVAPTTVAPTTVAPTTVAPTTAAPTTVAPTTTQPQTGDHSVDVYFKTSNTYAYQPKVNDGTSTVAMTKSTLIGPSYSGAMNYYWYKATLTLSGTKSTTLTFTTQMTSMSAAITQTFTGSTYYLACDDLMYGNAVVDLTAQPQYIRNYYHSALHMVASGTADDNTLGFTNIDGVVYQMGQLVNGEPNSLNDIEVSAKKMLTSVGATMASSNNKLSVLSATQMQKVSCSSASVSELQYQLLDVNLDGAVDVSDATLTQKCVAGY